MMFASVVQTIWSKLCGASYVVQATWWRLCDAIYVVPSVYGGN